MIVVNRTAREPYATIFIRDLLLRFEWRAGVGFCAEVENGHPFAGEIRTKVAGLPSYEIIDDVLPDAPPPQPEPAVKRARTWADEEYDVPPLIARAALNGWAYSDVTGAGANPGDTSRGACGLTAMQMALSEPPPGWSPRVKEADSYPWEIPGWRAPPDFIAPQVRQREIAPPEPLPEPVDVRFSDAPDSVPADDKDEPGPALESHASTEQERASVAAALVAMGVAPSLDVAVRMVDAALDTPRASTGGPPSRGKVNLTLRNRKLPQIVSDDVFDVVQPIL